MSNMANSKKSKKDSRLEGIPKRVASILEKLCNSSDENGNADPFLDDVQQLSKDEINDLIIQFNENVVDFKKDMEADMDLASKKEAYAEAAAVYREGIKVNDAKAVYCVYLKRSL